MSVQSISPSPPAPSRVEAGPIPRDAKATASPAQRERQDKSSAPVDREQLRTAVQNLHEYIQPINSGVEFSISDETKQVVVKVVDSQTKEVIRQIPSEEMISIAKALDSLKGLLIRQKA